MYMCKCMYYKLLCIYILGGDVDSTSSLDNSSSSNTEDIQITAVTTTGDTSTSKGQL